MSLRYLIRLAFLLTAALLASSLSARAERLALVIGNGDYKSVPFLPNPTRDAAGVAEALRGLGFEVVPAYDLNRAALNETVLNFAYRVSQEKPETAMIYYAGHGIELGGSNYLIPTDARLESDLMIEEETVNLRSLINAVSGASGLGLVVLDACRENPFSNRMRSVAGLTRSVSRGLGRPPEGLSPHLMVAYAAQSGALASDGDSGGHSPYAQALIEALQGESLNMVQLFGKVKDRVSALTGREQEPWVYQNFGQQIPHIHPTPPAGGVSDIAKNLALCEEVPLFGERDRGASLFKVKNFIMRHDDNQLNSYREACKFTTQIFSDDWRFHARIFLLYLNINNQKEREYAFMALNRAAKLGKREAAPAILMLIGVIKPDPFNNLSDLDVDGLPIAALLTEAAKDIQATEWVREGAEIRNPLAMFYMAIALGGMPPSYEDDEMGKEFRDLLGVSPDPDQGRLWLRRAAEAGESISMVTLCELQLHGAHEDNLISQDAQDWCRMALLAAPDDDMKQMVEERIRELNAR